MIKSNNFSSQEAYVAPVCECVEAEIEGILSASTKGNINDVEEKEYGDF